MDISKLLWHPDKLLGVTWAIILTSMGSFNKKKLTERVRYMYLVFASHLPMVLEEWLVCPYTCKELDVYRCKQLHNKL